MDKQEWRKFELIKRPEPLGSFEEEIKRRKEEGIKLCPLCGRETKEPDFLKNNNIMGNIKIQCRCGGYVTFEGKEKEKEEK